jgi:hypothetical protein
MTEMLSTIDPDGDSNVTAKSSGSSASEAIRAAVIRMLGRPPGLFRIVVLPLWSNHYRVNVLIGSDASAVSIPHSFFVKAGEQGIVSSSPPIAKLYK